MRHQSERKISNMSKSLLKMRKKWLISPVEQVEEPKRKPLAVDDDEDYRQYLGSTSEKIVDEDDIGEEEIREATELHPPDEKE